MLCGDVSRKGLHEWAAGGDIGTKVAGDNSVNDSEAEVATGAEDGRDATRSNFGSRDD